MTCQVFMPLRRAAKGSRKFDRVAERADAMAGGRMGEPGLTDWVPQQLGAVKR